MFPASAKERFNMHEIYQIKALALYNAYVIIAAWDGMSKLPTSSKHGMTN
jgi:hypothetical protein